MGVAFGKRWGNAASGAASGAAIGSVFGGVGAPIGAGIGAVAGLLSMSEEEKMQQAQQQRQTNFDAFKRAIEARKNTALSEGTQKIGALTGGLVTRFRSDATRRALAGGQVNDAEAYQLPVVNAVANSGNSAMANFVTDTNRAYDNTLNNADQQFMLSQNQFATDQANLPGVTDYLGQIAPAALKYKSGTDYLNMMKRYYDNGILPPGETVSASGTGFYG
jgi:hypothetical protein